MKKILVGLTALFVFSMFFACKDPVNSVPAENEANQNENTSDSEKENGSSTENPVDKGNGSGTGGTSTIVTKSGVKFNFAGANAVAKLEASKSTGAKAAVDANSLGDLVKILSDGTMEDAITVEEGASLSNIVAIYKSPVEGSDDVFVVFEGTSVISREETQIEHTDDWGYTWTESTFKENKIGQLICVHSDGTIADILKKDVEENTNEKDYYYDYDAKNYLSLRTDTVTFDVSGNVYFIVNDSYWDYDKNGYGSLVDNGQCIYQFNPKTNELTKMVAAVQGTSYSRMQIDNEGQWIFTSGSRNSASFLYAIPISNPNSPEKVYYSSDSYCLQDDKWAYDDNSGLLFYIVKAGKEDGLFKASKKGKFKDKTFIHASTSVGLDGFDGKDLFNSFYCNYTSYEWKDSCLDDDDNFVAEKAVESLLHSLWYDYAYEKDNFNSYTRYLTLDEVDIRFDAFEDEEDGALHVLYELTKGKKNAEALEALNSFAGLAALANATSDSRYQYESAKDGYKNNFYADILYVKGTDTLVADYDKVLLSYYYNYISEFNDDTSEWEYTFLKKDLKGTDIFPKTKKGYYTNSSDLYNLISQGYSGDYPSVVTYSVNKTSEEMLEYLFSFCDVEGEKEFRLDAFEDDDEYGEIYTSKKNEAAIDWLISDTERLSIFAEAMGQGWRDHYVEANSSWVYEMSVDTGMFISFIAKTCYLKGTDTKAVSAFIEKNISIPYCSQYDSYISFNGYSGWGTGRLSTGKDGVYYEFTNLYNNWYDDGKPFYYIVQISNADGEFVEKSRELELPTGKVVESQKTRERIVMQYSLLTETGAETGSHHIYSVELASGEVINHFDNVPNRNGLEVISFSTAGNFLYYSAVRGTVVENGIVNIETNEFNPLEVQRKMVAVYAF